MKNKKHTLKPHGYNEDGTPFWIGPSGIKHNDYQTYLEDMENDIREDVI